MKLGTKKPDGARGAFSRKLPIKTAGKSLDVVERVALSLGMRLALAPMVGLLLNYTPWEVRLTPITLSLAALTPVLVVTALLRESKLATKMNTAHKTQIPNSEET